MGVTRKTLQQVGDGRRQTAGGFEPGGELRRLGR
jgi:hypothetical protein